MFNHLFDNARGVAGYPMFSLLVFVIFFIAVAFHVIKVKKTYVEEMSNMPLDKDEKKPGNF